MDGTAVKEIRELTEQAGTRIIEVGGVEYSTRELHDLRKPNPAPGAIKVTTLAALIAYITDNPDNLALEDLQVHVVSPRRVDLVGRLHGHFQQRFTYLTAETPDRLTAARELFSWGRWVSVEEMTIALLALCADQGDRAYVLQLIGNITSESVSTQRDNGHTQVVTARVGVASVDNVPVKNPVTLAPFRTFPEIEQPESPFVLRIRKGDREGVTCALFEADGGAWMSKAIDTIAGELGAALEQAELDELPILA